MTEKVVVIFRVTDSQRDYDEEEWPVLQAGGMLKMSRCDHSRVIAPVDQGPLEAKMGFGKAEKEGFTSTNKVSKTSS